MDITVTRFKSEIKSQATHSLDVPCQAPWRACIWSMSPLTWRTLRRAELCFRHRELQRGFFLKPQDIAPTPTGQLHQHLTATCTPLKVKQNPFLQSQGEACLQSQQCEHQPTCSSPTFLPNAADLIPRSLQSLRPTSSSSVKDLRLSPALWWSTAANADW